MIAAIVLSSRPGPPAQGIATSPHGASALAHCGMWMAWAAGTAISACVVSGARGQEASFTRPSAEAMTIRVRPDISPTTIRLIAKASESETHQVRQGATTAEIAKRVYGAANTTTIALAAHARLVAGAGTGDAAIVELPAAPRWNLNVPYVVRPTETIYEIARRFMGEAGDRSVAAIRNANPGLPADLRRLRAGTLIIIPYIATFTTLTPKADLLDEVGFMKASLTTSRAVLAVDPAFAYSVTPSVRTDLLSSTSGCGGTRPTKWAYSTLKLDTCVQQHQYAGKVTIAVLDTGLVNDDKRFTPLLWPPPKSLWFWRNGKIVRPRGINMFGEDRDPVDDCRATGSEYHGTRVCGLAVGRLMDDQTRQVIDRHLRLMVIKVANSDGAVDGGVLHTAIQLAVAYGAKIVNLSLHSVLAVRGPGGLERDFEDNRTTLFVVAAGNGESNVGRNIDAGQGRPWYPASLSSDYGNVLSVAASDETGHVTCFSNFGSRSVDLSAPGYAVETTVPVSGGHAGEDAFTGTSAAAPLVSLVAGLMMAEDSSLMPNDVKRRLIATVDSVDNRRENRAHGTMNPCRALDLCHDIVVLKGPGNSALPGRLSEYAFPIGGEQESLSAVDAVVMGSSQGSDRVQLQDGVKNPQFVEVARLRGNFVIRDDRGVAHTLAADEVSRIVPRMCSE